MDKKSGKREAIIEAALTLFSERGYDGVGMDEIADAVGMKGPALYYYFKGKDALLEGLIETVEAHYTAHFGSGEQAGPVPADVDELIELSMQRIAFTLHDTQVCRVRRLLAMEQFRSERLGGLATRHQLTGLVQLYAAAFAQLIRAGKVKAYDPQLLAFEFIAPVSLLIQLVDREPAREAEAMAAIRQHMAHFAALYTATDIL